MKTQSPDTSPEAERVQIALPRQASGVRRLQVAIELSQMVLEMAWRAIRRVSPQLSEREARLRRIELTYGTAVAGALRSHSVGRECVSLPANIRSGLLPVIATFDKLAIPYYIDGSVASAHHGIPRSPLDVDVVAEVRPDQGRPFIETLGPDYYVSEEAVREAIRRRSSFNVIHQPTMIKVDIFIRGQRPYDAQAFSRARAERDPTDQRDLPWVSSEDSILSKLERYRMGGEVSERQWGDVLGVLKVQGPALDLAHLRIWAATLGVADLPARALDDADLGERQQP